MKVLLVEDDPAVAAGVLDGLGVGFSVTHVSTGADALSALSDSPVDIILLDLGLPDMDGTDVCRTVRQTSQVPIIVVSARGDEIDRVLTLEMGADDYVVKPEADLNDPVHQVHGLSIDTRTQRVELAGEEIHLTPKEFDLVVYLTKDPGAVYRRQDILHDVWDTNWYGTSKTLDAHVAAIRKKLGSPTWIESVRGVGFRFGGPE
jgi:two-component system, OmpR family, response regulator RegX3